MLKSETETVVQYDLESRKATMFTRIPKDIRRMDILCKEFPNDYECIKKDEFGSTYIFDMKRVLIQRPRKAIHSTKEEKERIYNIMKNSRDV